ncbi:protein YIPF1-like isoform X1 [Hydra vulgaris]|uniref:Protein YIPF n=1 Tax=Hydra vulgaris TaxID=6087 RepID=A0ABM4C8A3_HYDVU
MSSKGYSTIQLLDQSDSDDEKIIPQKEKSHFEFQEFPHPVDILSETERGEIKSTTLEDSDDDERNDKKELLKGTKKEPSFWTFEYYQAFFDVDTYQVLTRILHSVIPSYQNYLLTKIRPNPDLYGPFWICSTLVFTIAICGNLSSFFAAEGSLIHFKSDFQLVSLSACVIFSYGWVVPAISWGYLTWRGNPVGFSFLEIVCVYGYSLAIFIPISIMWVVPFDWLRWIFVAIGVLTSGSVLVRTFWTALQDESKKVAFLFVLAIIALHTILAVGFKLYFFKSIRYDILYPQVVTPVLPSIRTLKQHNTFAP